MRDVFLEQHVPRNPMTVNNNTGRFGTPSGGENVELNTPAAWPNAMSAFMVAKKLFSKEKQNAKHSVKNTGTYVALVTGATDPLNPKIKLVEEFGQRAEAGLTG